MCLNISVSVNTVQLHKSVGTSKYFLYYICCCLTEFFGLHLKNKILSESEISRKNQRVSEVQSELSSEGFKCATQHCSDTVNGLNH